MQTPTEQGVRSVLHIELTSGGYGNSHQMFNEMQVHLVVNKLMRELKEEVNLLDTVNT